MIRPAPTVSQPVTDEEEVEAIEPAEEDNAPVGPSEDEESAFIAEERLSVSAPVAAAEEIEDDLAPAAMPSMAELSKRVPAEVLEVMDELFRAKFAKVQRVPSKHLKKN